ncbi:MAG: methionyl-tRNA formyltransferase [Deltaproteobacteria bacterium]|nr:methionyl-tRNA formyltransferase [Deltaproteobacteria bacterium]
MSSPIKNTVPSHPRIVFMGTPDFAIPTLMALILQGHHLLAVVTQPDRPKGRGKKMIPTPVKRLALEHNLPVLQPEKASDRQFCEQLREMNPDLIIVVAFGQILRKNVLDIPKWGAINIHSSLLPKYRGAAPIQWALFQDEEKTGLTIMRMDEGLDTGAILFQKEVPILKDETAGHLHDRLAQTAGDLIITSLQEMHRGAFEEQPQDDTDATYAPKIDKSMTHIDWNQPAAKISALIRALDPVPGARTTLEGKEVKLFSSWVMLEGEQPGDPGMVLNNNEKALFVKTAHGAVGIGEIQAPGKKRMPVADFLRGFPLAEKAILGE